MSKITSYLKCPNNNAGKQFQFKNLFTRDIYFVFRYELFNYCCQNKIVMKDQVQLTMKVNI